MQKMIVFVFLLAISLMPISALEGEDGVQGMARFFPDQTDVFVSARIDEAYITTLQDLINNAIVKLPPEAELLPVDLIAQFDGVLQQNGLSFADLQVWLGDYIAFGIDGFELTTDSNAENDEKVAVVAALKITDREAFEAFFAQAPNIDNLEYLEDLDGFTVYVDREEDLQLSIGQEVVYLSTIGDAPRSDTPRLNTLPDYLDTIGALPAEQYNILLYANLRPLVDIMDSMGTLDVQTQGLLNDTLQSISIGLTILEGQAMTIDIVQAIPDNNVQTPINLDYARFIPADTQFLIWGANLTNLYSQIIDQFSMLNAMQSNNQDIGAQFESIVRVAGIDLQEDVLSWTTGDFAIIGGLDADTILDAVISNTPNFEQLPLSFGLLIEATDADTAGNFVAKLGNFMAQSLGAQAQDTLTITEGDIDGESVWTLSTELPMNGDVAPITVNIDLGVSNGTFYLATRDVATTIRQRGASLADDARYQFGSRFFLPDALSLFYTDDEGLISFVGVLGLTLVGPAIGNVFDNILDGLQTWRPTRTLIDTRAQEASPAEVVPLVFNTLKSIIHSSSITSNLATDRLAITRLVLVLEN